MSRNSAWHAYNESADGINAAYEEVVGPLRKNLSSAIERIQNKFDAAVAPHLKERDAALKQYNEEFNKLLRTAVLTRDNGIVRARQVLDAELKEQKAAAASDPLGVRAKAPEPKFTSAKTRTVPS